jgi:hypothetical protein
MKSLSIGFAAGLLIGAVAIAHARLPAPSAEEKAAAAAKAEKDAAGKAKAAKELSGAHDRAAENYRKNKRKSATPSSGADHAKSRAPDADLTRREAQNEMPKPGQANDHSTTARDPQNSSGRR